MMQRYAVFTGSCQSLSAIQYLQQTNKLACVVLADAEPNPDLMQLQQLLHQAQIPTLQYNQHDDMALIADLDRLGANRGVIYLFRHILKQTLISYFDGSLVNIHPSPLPEYRGPFPLYWQIRNGEQATKLTLHHVTSKVDSGDIAIDIDLTIHPFDTISIVNQKVSQALPHLLNTFCQLEEQENISWREQDTCFEHFAPMLEPQQLAINWCKQPTSEIVNMCRAGNVDVGCATFCLRQEMFQLLQASELECDIKGVQAGTVIQLSRREGLVIKTLDGAVCLDVIGTQQGLFDGYRFAVLFGLDAGFSLI
ncbi:MULTISPECIES: methionyl-tRNA formyltransferase [unclassified Pseudoalteromonas]|uniref:methionyl-tRNA formyltransferase n=1 Tax=unclassified Pseudoalteromonas TaxID=194690 RepID=UPI001F3CD202|nr:hypothetical protein L3Q70_18460 [Pseudoalteromonas sp. CF6-2]